MKNKTKRKLSEEEKRLSHRGISVAERELRYLNYSLKYNELVLEQGLDINYEKTKRRILTETTDIKNRIRIEEEKIRTLKKQLAEGV